VEALLDCLDIVGAAPPGRYAKEARYALLLSLSEYQLSEVPENRRPSVLKQVREWYANDPSSGVHGAANWLLRQWGEQAYVKQIDETPMAPSADREWFTLAVKVKPTPPVRMDFVDAAKRDSVFRERAAVSSHPWKVSFFHWDETGSKDPPTDLKTVLNSSVKAQWETENLSFHWGKGLPVQDVKNDHFAAVATRSITLSKEPCAAIVTFDDGVRVWLDDQIIYENWGFNDIKSAAVLIENKPGDHTLKIDYIKIGGGYTLRWEPVNQATLDEFQAAFRPRSFYYTFVVFPAGEYTIGSPEDEQPKREKDEVLHRVRLTRSFAILNREVTFAELIAFNRERYEDYMGQVSQHPESSVSAVDWYDAVQFSRCLGTQYGLSEGDQAYADPDSPSSGPRETSPSANWAPLNWPLDPSRRGFRLPSEAEWEIASRGDVRTSYGFGSDVGLLDRYGWFEENSGGRMHLPMERRPSHRGLFDMHGNTFEWVHDWYGNYGGSRAADPLGATGGSNRVYRGGSWYDRAANCRTALRLRNVPTFRADDLGFRLALSPVGVAAESGQDKKK
jgi:formylglycine-generating enzyme required for sulfatase activity